MPRFGLSIIASAFAVQAIAMGLSISMYPVFMASIESEFEVSRAVTSLGMPLVLLMGALLSPWIGRRIDRDSPRQIMVVGALLMTAGLAGMAWAPTFPLAAMFWICAVGAGQAMLGPLPAMTVLANWFIARRATAMAIAAMGTTFGAAVAPPLSEALIEALGWRGAIASLGITAAALGVPIVLVGIRKRPEDVGAYPDGATAPPPRATGPGIVRGRLRDFLLDSRFWMVGGAFALMSGAGLAFNTHVVPFAIERGIPREQAVMLLTLNAICAAMGKLVFGALSDRIGVRSASRMAVLLQAAGWLGVAYSSDAVSYAASAVAFSLGLGCAIPCKAAFVAELYGREHFGRAAGLMAPLMIAGGFLVAPPVGYAYDALGSYDVPMRVVAFVVLAPFALFSLVRAAGREIETRPAAT